MLKYAKAAFVSLVVLASPAAAEFELSLYLGAQSVTDSDASGTLPGGGGAFNANIDWEGNPFDMPIYYGGRAMWWNSNDIGFGIEGTHTKAIAPSAQAAAIGLGRFELSDGHNIFTANIMKRWPGAFNNGKFTPYVGGGLGIAVPHVDAIVAGPANRTFGFEFTGPAVRGIAGIKYDFNDRWAIFSEYQFTWSDNEITIDPVLPGQIPGELNTELLTHAVNIGISYSF